jgi:hypothetical protein
MKYFFFSCSLVVMVSLIASIVQLSHAFSNFRSVQIYRAGKKQMGKLNVAGQFAKFEKDSEGNPRSKQEVDRLYQKEVLLNTLPTVILSLDYHFNLREKFPQFKRAFLKGKKHFDYTERWMKKNDTLYNKEFKTRQLTQWLKEAYPECIEEYETRFKCKGFFHVVIQELEAQVNPPTDVTDLPIWKLTRAWEWRINDLRNQTVANETSVKTI